MPKPKYCMAFGGPVDTQELPIMGKRLEVIVTERWRPVYIYDYLLVGDRIIAVYAGLKESDG